VPDVLRSDAFRRARSLVDASSRLVVFSGAGISAASGVPTFRDAGGLWRNHDPMQLATPQAFQRNPAMVWAWYAWRRNLVAACQPNAAHHAIADRAGTHPPLTVVTQNVDGLHQRAGDHSVLALHGSLFVTRCTGCHHERDESRTWTSVGAHHWPSDVGTPSCTGADPPPPRCTRCGAIERPGVVWFGESLPQSIWRAAESAVQTADLLLVVGTSATVYPAAGLVEMGRACGCAIIVVNPDVTAHADSADVHLQASAHDILPELLRG
jgi:NAD-dependent deacetylase